MVQYYCDRDRSRVRIHWKLKNGPISFSLLNWAILKQKLLKMINFECDCQNGPVPKGKTDWSTFELSVYSYTWPISVTVILDHFGNPRVLWKRIKVNFRSRDEWIARKYKKPRKWVKVYFTCISITWIGLLHILYRTKVYTPPVFFIFYYQTCTDTCKRCFRQKIVSIGRDWFWIFLFRF